MKDLTAKDNMTSPPNTVAPDLGVWSALAIMRDQDIRHLLVADGDRLAGVLSNRDYRKLLLPLRPDGSVRDVDKSRVREIMTDWGQVVTVTPDMTLLDCADLIVRRKVGCLPVLDGQGRAVGILTQKDVMAGLLGRARS